MKNTRMGPHLWAAARGLDAGLTVSDAKEVPVQLTRAATREAPGESAAMKGSA
ncbi:MAG TPA: hypothetical protein VIP10_08320 [Burkholderiaceae bacterium]